MLSTEKQGQLLGETLVFNLIDHKKVIRWVHEVISNSEVAEPWMLRISFATDQGAEETAHLLNIVFGSPVLLTFTEIMAAFTALCQVKGESISAVLHLLVLVHDSFLAPPNDPSCQQAIATVLELEARVFAEDYGEAVERMVEPEFNKLTNLVQVQHAEVVEFITKFA